MSKNKRKKSFIFYEDWAMILSDYPDEMRLRFYDAIVGYALFGKEPDDLPGFRFVQSQIDRDIEKYDRICERNRKNGENGGAPVGNDNARKTTQNNPKQPKTTQTTQNNLDNDNDNEDDNDIKENSPKGLQKKDELSFDLVSISDRKDMFRTTLSPYIPKYGQKMVDDFALYWTTEISPNVMRFEAERTFSIHGRLATWFKRSMTTLKSVTDIDGKSALYGIDWDKVSSWFRNLGLPLAKLTDKRKLAYISIFDCYGGDMVRIRDALSRFTEEVRKSDWILGNGSSPPKDFEWLFTLDNFLKVIEGRYKNNPKTRENEDNTKRQEDRRKTFISEHSNGKPHNSEF